MKLYKMAFFVPESHVETVKQAVFAAGAGRIGDYDACCWQTLGQGQFRPLPGSQPFIGQTHRIECVPEYKVEMVCSGSHIKAALAALRTAHPYEEPAIDVWALESDL